jgi:hypothetical protein
VVYGMLTLGPLPPAAYSAATGTGRADAAIAETMLAMIPPDAPVAASYALLPRLSSRETLVAFHYAFLGVTQFGTAPYALPDDLRYVALDIDDLRSYHAGFTRTAWAAPYFAGGFERLRAIGGVPVFAQGRYLLIDRQAGADDSVLPSFLPEPVASAAFTGGTALAAAAARYEDGALEVVSAWSRVVPENGLALRVILRDALGRVALDQCFPLYQTVSRLRIPFSGTGIYYPELRLQRDDAVLVLNGIRSSVRRTLKSEELGRASLPAIEVTKP